MDIDGLFTGLASFAIEDSSSARRNSHAVDELMHVANQLIVLMDGKVLSKHPIGECLHEFCSLFAVESSKNSGGHLLEVSDEHGIRGFSSNFDFVETKAELLA